MRTEFGICGKCNWDMTIIGMKNYTKQNLLSRFLLFSNIRWFQLAFRHNFRKHKRKMHMKSQKF